MDHPRHIPTESARGQGSIWAPATVLLLLGAILGLGIREVESRAQSRVLVFDPANAEWREMPSPGQDPSDLLVAGDGSAWGLSLLGLSRWNGQSWQVFQPYDLDLTNANPRGAIHLDGSELWAVTSEGVIQWDGKRWRHYHEAATSNSASMAVGGGQVWLMDSTSTLAHFEDGHWENRKTALLGVDKPPVKDPSLARTKDGTVWLLWGGLWRLNGWQWEGVPAAVGFALRDAQLLGSAGERLWLRDAKMLCSVSGGGKQWEVFKASTTGIAENVSVLGLAGTGKRTYFATAAGIVDWDGSTWRKLPPPASGRGLGKVAAAPDGELWALDLPPLDPLHNVRVVTPLLMVPVALIAISGLAFARFNRRQLHQHERVTQAVRYATGEIPYGLQRAAKRLSWKGRMINAVLFLGTIAGFVMLRRRWPGAPVWTAPLIASLIHLAFTFQRSLVKRKPRGALAGGSHPRYDWAKTGKIFAGGLLILTLYNADRLPGVSLLRGFVIWVVLLAPIGYNALMLGLMERAVRRGDYGQALAVVQRFHFFNPNGMLPLRLCGHILLQAGRYAEAEDFLRRGLASALGGEDYGFALEHLGDTLMEQGRAGEALRSYEAALHAVVWLRRPYRGMAEMLLRCDQDPNGALLLIERILNDSGMSWRERKANGSCHRDYWALRAWALAGLGRRSEVLPAIESAIKATNRRDRPELATIHYRAGMAMRALGKHPAARRHFQLAAELDPQGRRGGLARQAIGDYYEVREASTECPESSDWSPVQA